MGSPFLSIVVTLPTLRAIGKVPHSNHKLMFAKVTVSKKLDHCHYFFEIKMCDVVIINY